MVHLNLEFSFLKSRLTSQNQHVIARRRSLPTKQSPYRNLSYSACECCHRTFEKPRLNLPQACPGRIEGSPVRGACQKKIPVFSKKTGVWDWTHKRSMAETSHRGCFFPSPLDHQRVVEPRQISHTWIRDHDNIFDPHTELAHKIRSRLDAENHSFLQRCLVPVHHPRRLVSF